MHGNIKRNAWATFGTQEKIEAIIEAYDGQHNTASSLASKLSALFECDITRNSVVGIYQRHKAKNDNTLQNFPLAGNNPNIGGSLRNRFFGLPKVVKERVIKPPVVKKTKVAPIKNPNPPKGSELPFDMRFPAAPEPLLKTLMEMERHECRWPVDGERAAIRFCCHDVTKGKPYCGFHHRLSRGNGTPSERAAHRVSKGNMSI